MEVLIEGAGHLEVLSVKDDPSDSDSVVITMTGPFRATQFMLVRRTDLIRLAKVL